MDHRVIVFDIDGVLADCHHRLLHILKKDPKDWDTFDSLISLDKPIYNCIRLLWAISTNPFIDIILLTGRNERTREDTEKWLHCQDIPFTSLEMRGLKDYRPAAVIKVERLKELKHEPDSVVTVFEDEPNTVKALRQAGYHVCDVGGWDDSGYNEALHTGGRR